MIRPYVLIIRKYEKQTGFDLAVLPWGATEVNNYYLPIIPMLLKDLRLPKNQGGLHGSKEPKYLYGA